MNIAVLYGTTRGSTGRLAKDMKDYLSFPYDIYNVKDVNRLDQLADYDFFLFLCPTYGDTEPQEDIENFLLKFDMDMTGKYFAICRIGTYEGYDSFEPSCGRIVRSVMLEHHAFEAVPPISVDSLPGIDMRAVEHWCRDHLNPWVASHV